MASICRSHVTLRREDGLLDHTPETHLQLALRGTPTELSKPPSCRVICTTYAVALLRLYNEA